MSVGARTVTLTDFLNARIAEDEERARHVDSQRDDWAKSQVFEPWLLSWQDEYDLLCIEPSRALAACLAKRRIVELGTAPYLYSDQARVVHNVSVAPILRALASEWADHPDFNPEWKP